GAAGPFVVLRLVHGGVVPRAADRLDGLLGGDVAGDDGAFGGVVDGGADPVESVELPFDAVRACGAGHAGDVDGDRFVRWCGAVGGELVGGHGGHRVRSLSESFLSMSL